LSEKCGTINTAIPCEGVRLITCDTANVIKERNQKHIEDDYGIYECWDKIVRILPEDAQATIHYLEKIAEQGLHSMPAKARPEVSEIRDDTGY